MKKLGTHGLGFSSPPRGNPKKSTFFMRTEEGSGKRSKFSRSIMHVRSLCQSAGRYLQAPGQSSRKACGIRQFVRGCDGIARQSVQVPKHKIVKPQIPSYYIRVTDAGTSYHHGWVLAPSGAHLEVLALAIHSSR